MPVGESQVDTDAGQRDVHHVASEQSISWVPTMVASARYECQRVGDGRWTRWMRWVRRWRGRARCAWT